MSLAKELHKKQGGLVRAADRNSRARAQAEVRSLQQRQKGVEQRVMDVQARMKDKQDEWQQAVRDKEGNMRSIHKLRDEVYNHQV